jgi:hypothetical protein
MQLFDCKYNAVIWLHKYISHLLENIFLSSQMLRECQSIFGVALQCPLTIGLAAVAITVSTPIERSLPKPNRPLIPRVCADGFLALQSPTLVESHTSFILGCPIPLGQAGIF